MRRQTGDVWSRRDAKNSAQLFCNDHRIVRQHRRMTRKRNSRRETAGTYMGSEATEFSFPIDLATGQLFSTTEFRTIEQRGRWGILIFLYCYRMGRHMCTYARMQAYPAIRRAFYQPLVRRVCLTATRGNKSADWSDETRFVIYATSLRTLFLPRR